MSNTTSPTTAATPVESPAAPLSVAAEAVAPVAAPAPAAVPVAPPVVERPPENVIHVEGVLDIDIQKGGNGQLLDLTRYGKRRPSDTFVPKELIRRFKLRQGSRITGTAWPA